MAELSQLQRTARVLQLLDESFRAHLAGDRTTADLRAAEACGLDVDVVSVVQGGIMIGEIPSPERDYEAWADYVDDAVARAAEEAGRG